MLNLFNYYPHLKEAYLYIYFFKIHHTFKDLLFISIKFYIVLYQLKLMKTVPKIAIELQGGEHFGNIEREKCDTRKSQIFKEKGITLLEIPNSFIKSYETIKELILTSCGQEVEQLELL